VVDRAIFGGRVVDGGKVKRCKSRVDSDRGVVAGPVDDLLDKNGGGKLKGGKIKVRGKAERRKKGGVGRTVK